MKESWELLARARKTVSEADGLKIRQYTQNIINSIEGWNLVL
jgi:hypothetical protein